MNDIVVTQIRQSDKGGLFSVYTQRGFEFSLSAKGLADTGIRAGSAFTQEEFAELSEYAQAEKAYRHAVYLLGFRAYSASELISKLSEYGEYAERAVAKLEQQGYVDDEAYADDIIEKYRRKYGPARLKTELRKRGISPQIWEDKLIEAYDDPVSDIERHIKEKLRGRVPADRKERDRVFSFLMRRGYAADDMKRAMELCFGRDIEEM